MKCYEIIFSEKMALVSQSAKLVFQDNATLYNMFMHNDVSTAVPVREEKSCKMTVRYGKHLQIRLVFNISESDMLISKTQLT